jgi:hypothetical protein
LQLITAVHIEGFRSLVDVDLQSLGNFTCLVGTNNSGKSNILRALNLFFTGDIEPGVPLRFSRDYHADPRRRKKRKQIRVTVSFCLPSGFKFRQGLEEVEQWLGTAFSIRKTWRLHQRDLETEVRSLDGKFTHIPPTVVKQFTDLVNFRYIPNRTVPADTLRNEAPAFEAFLKRRLKLKQDDVLTEALGKIRTTASETIAQANDSLIRSTDSLQRLEMTTVQDLTALVLVSGFQAESQTGAKISDVAWGAGTQAHMMFQLLRLIDTDFGTHFGWRQAAIWAVEEPESSLHLDLEQRLALSMRGWGDVERPRMQLLATTHSEVFTSTADTGFVVTLADGKSAVSGRSIPQLVETAARLRISPPVEPVLCFLHDPVVLVEGPNDARVLSLASQLTGAATRCRFMSLRGLDPSHRRSGAEALAEYVKKRSRLISNRPAAAPLAVLFDCDVSNAFLAQVRDDYGSDGDVRVIRMDPAHADQQISTDIRGIERFYPPALYHAARNKQGLSVATDQHGCVSMEPSKLKRAKATLAEVFCSAADPAWCQGFAKVLQDVDTATSPTATQLSFR